MEGAYERIAPALGDKMRIYSETLDLYLCWEDGRLRFWDPATEEYLNDYDEAEDARIAAEVGWQVSEAGRQAAEAGQQAAEDALGLERDARRAAEAGQQAAEDALGLERDARRAAEAELKRLREQLGR